jgi:hypothetical protein
VAGGSRREAFFFFGIKILKINNYFLKNKKYNI